MPKFRAFVKGTNLLIHSEDSQQIVPSGFYVNAFVDAQSAEAARDSALTLVRQSHVYASARNASDNPPRIEVEKVEEIAEWPADTQRPLTGFALHDETTQSASTHKHLTRRCSQPLAGVQPHFFMTKTHSFQTKLGSASGG